MSIRVQRHTVRGGEQIGGDRRRGGEETAVVM